MDCDLKSTVHFLIRSLMKKILFLIIFYLSLIPVNAQQVQWAKLSDTILDFL